MIYTGCTVLLQQGHSPDKTVNNVERERMFPEHVAPVSDEQDNENAGRKIHINGESWS